MQILMAEMPTWHFTFERPAERRAERNEPEIGHRLSGNRQLSRTKCGWRGSRGAEHSHSLLSGSRTLIAVNDPTNIFKSWHLCMQTYSYAHEQEPFAVWTSSFMATLIKSKQGPNFVKHLTDV